MSGKKGVLSEAHFKRQRQQKESRDRTASGKALVGAEGGTGSVTLFITLLSHVRDCLKTFH